MKDDFNKAAREARLFLKCQYHVSTDDKFVIEAAVETIEKLEAEILAYKKSLVLIAASHGKCLLGGWDSEPARAYESGSNAAFNQCAEIAKDALEEK